MNYTMMHGLTNLKIPRSSYFFSATSTADGRGGLRLTERQRDVRLNNPNHCQNYIWTKCE